MTGIARMRPRSRCSRSPRRASPVPSGNVATSTSPATSCFAATSMASAVSRRSRSGTQASTSTLPRRSRPTTVVAFSSAGWGCPTPRSTSTRPSGTAGSTASPSRARSPRETAACSRAPCVSSTVAMRTRRPPREASCMRGLAPSTSRSRESTSRATRCGSRSPTSSWSPGTTASSSCAS